VDLRYGINPHQAARTVDGPGTAPVRVVSGTPSYINLLDALSAWQLVGEATAATGRIAATSFKHVSPAGAALAGALDSTAGEAWGVDPRSAGPLTSAYVRARDADPKSSFGDLIAVSHPVDAELADLLSRVVSDGIIAPGYHPGTVASLAAKKRGTFLVLEAVPDIEPPPWERRDHHGLILEQQRDRTPITADLLDGATSTDDTRWDALLGLVTARHTQSNSVVLVANGMAVGIGAGQQNRVDCVRLAAAKTRTWWLRRHPHIRGLPIPTGMTRQDHLNWQIRMADADMTRTQRAQFAALFPTTDPDLSPTDRADWIGQLDDLTLVSDGFLPFRDNIDHAASIGVRHVVEPGGSIRADDVAEACAEQGITLTRTGRRLFNH
jgi:phosphoribosylaminoimidazolecarboxamide formyltransferase / IMP cyclohydrolase